MLYILLQRHRDTEAEKTFLTRLLAEYDVPDVIHTDQLGSYGAAIREIPSLFNVDHQQVISTARYNDIVEQRASVMRRHRRCSAQDNLIVLHSVKNGNSKDLEAVWKGVMQLLGETVGRDDGSSIE